MVMDSPCLRSRESELCFSMLKAEAEVKANNNRERDFILADLVRSVFVTLVSQGK